MLREIGTHRYLVDAIRGFDRRLKALTRAHADWAIFASLPGAGQVHMARLISALGMDCSRYERVDDLLTFAGIAPVLERSGRTMLTHMCWCCPTFIRQSFHEYAGQAIPHCHWAKTYYRQQRIRGKAHHAAVRALAFTWIRIIFPLLEKSYALRRADLSHSITAAWLVTAKADG